MKEQEARALNDLFDYLMVWPGEQSIKQAPMPSELAMDAARFLAEQAYAKLNAGWCADDVCKAWGSKEPAEVHKCRLVVKDLLQLCMGAPRDDVRDQAWRLAGKVGVSLSPLRSIRCQKPLACGCPKCIDEFGPIHPDNIGKDLRSNPAGEVKNPRKA